MYRYTGILRLDGNVYNEIIKEKMSAAEVMILRKLHGDDAFRELTELSTDCSDYDEERAKLMRIYVADGRLESRTKFNEVNFITMFGPAHMQLPERLPEFKIKQREEEEQAEHEKELMSLRPKKTDTDIDAISKRMKAVRAARTFKAKDAKKKINKNKNENRRPNKVDTKTPTLAELAG